MDKLRLYLAGGLFTWMERDAREKEFALIKEAVGDKVDIYSPMHNDEINDKSKAVTPQNIYQQDTEEVLKADYLTCSLEDIMNDPGVAMEVGIALGVNAILKTLINMESSGIERLENATDCLFGNIPPKQIFVNVSDIRLLHNNPLIGMYKDQGVNQYCLGGLIDNHTISFSLEDSVEKLKENVDEYMEFQKQYYAEEGEE